MTEWRISRQILTVVSTAAVLRDLGLVLACSGSRETGTGVGSRRWNCMLRKRSLSKER